MDTRLQAEKPAKPVKPVPLSHSKKTRLGGDASMSFQARDASANQRIPFRLSIGFFSLNLHQSGYGLANLFFKYGNTPTRRVLD